MELGVSDVSRFSYTIMTHYDTGQYYSSWLDFRLRIYNATQEDSGIYRYAYRVDQKTAPRKVYFARIQ